MSQRLHKEVILAKHISTITSNNAIHPVVLIGRASISGRARAGARHPPLRASSLHSSPDICPALQLQFYNLTSAPLLSVAAPISSCQFSLLHFAKMSDSSEWENDWISEDDEEDMEILARFGGVVPVPVSETDKCTICLEWLEVISDEDNVQKLQCHHSFHELCLQKWSQTPGRRSRTCPNCRQIAKITSTWHPTRNPPEPKGNGFGKRSNTVAHSPTAASSAAPPTPGTSAKSAPSEETASTASSARTTAARPRQSRAKAAPRRERSASSPARHTPKRHRGGASPPPPQSPPRQRRGGAPSTPPQRSPPKERRFQCHICPLYFKRNLDLTLHMVSHAAPLPAARNSAMETGISVAAASSAAAPMLKTACGTRTDLIDITLEDTDVGMNADVNVTYAEAEESNDARRFRDDTQQLPLHRPTNVNNQNNNVGPFVERECQCGPTPDRRLFYTQLGSARSPSQLLVKFRRSLELHGLSSRVRLLEIFRNDLSRAEQRALKNNCTSEPQEFIQRGDESLLVLFCTRVGHFCEDRCYVVCIIDWDAIPADLVDAVLATLPVLLPGNIRSHNRPSTDGIQSTGARRCPCQLLDSLSWQLGCLLSQGVARCCSHYSRDERNWGKKFTTLEVGNAHQQHAGEQCLHVIDYVADLTGEKLNIYAPLAHERMCQHSAEAHRCRLGKLPPSERPFSSATVVSRKRIHGHKDRNLNHGCTGLLTFSRGTPDQKHVLHGWTLKSGPSRINEHASLGFDLSSGSLLLEVSTLEWHSNTIPPSDDNDSNRLAIVLYQSPHLSAPDHNKDYMLSILEKKKMRKAQRKADEQVPPKEQQPQETGSPGPSPDVLQAAPTPGTSSGLLQPAMIRPSLLDSDSSDDDDDVTPGVEKEDSDSDEEGSDSEVKKDRDSDRQPLQKRYSCPICNFEAKSVRYLSKHLASVHTEKRTCDICDKTFQSITGLNRHRLLHTGEMPFKCERCPARFNRKANLNRHVKHASCAACPICNKTFASAQDLHQHKVVHTDQPQFKCEHCPAIYIRRESLLRHLKRSCPSRN